MSDLLISFLQENKQLIRLSELERACGIYQGAVTKAVNATEYRHLTADQEKAIRRYLISLSKSIEKNFVDKK